MPLTGPVVTVIDGVPHTSLADALPRAASIAADVGLHPSVDEVPVAVITGGIVLDVQVTVLDTVAVFPQASVAVNVLVCD